MTISHYIIGAAIVTCVTAIAIACVTLLTKRPKQRWAVFYKATDKLGHDVAFMGPTWWIARGFQGIALSRWRVHIKRWWQVQPPQRLLRHECAHCEQYRRHGWTFPFRYVGQFIFALGRSSKMPFEREARSWEKRLDMIEEVQRINEF